MKSLYLVVLLYFLPFLMIGQTISGDLMRWHKVTLSFEGPNTSETADTNPFSDYRLDVTFINGNLSYVVPGFYAGCNDAEESSCDSGNIWKVHFSPSQIGTWEWSAEFVTGSDVAVNGGGSNGGFMNGDTGSFNIIESNKTGRDHRDKDKGRLQYVGEHYLRYTGTNPNNPNGDWFVKGGADSPENALAYDDFDDTPNRGGRRKSWEPHQQDYEASDASEYTWQQGNGTELLGSINYLANKGVNAFSFLTFNVDGDDQNVFPHRLKVSVNEYNDISAEIINGIHTGTQWNQGIHKDRFDISKLAQWEKIFEYADKRGMYMHFKTMETENDHLMDHIEIDPTTDSESDQFGGLGRERKLYYRELIARFGHHLALNWNLSEESEIPTNMVIDIASYIKGLDPYGHHIVMHTYPGQWNQRYTPLLGDLSELTGASIQTSNYNIHGVVKNWIDNSREAGKKWVVACDEPGNASIGINIDDPEDDYDVRSQVLWPTFMAGGTGVEYYYGYQTGETDLSAQDHRSRDTKYTHVANTLQFFNDHLQEYLPDMISSDGITSDDEDYVYADSGNVYVVYRPNGGSTDLSLPTGNDNYDVQWYNPRTGDNLTTVTSLGDELTAPDNNDWIALITFSGTVEAINIPGLIEAEDFTAQSGVQTETTSDTGGGLNIGFIQQGDYVEYLVDVANAGTYEMNFRIASDNDGGDIIIESGESQVGEVTVPGTNGWQNWENATTIVDLEEGEQTLRFNFEGEEDTFLFNINNVNVEEFNEDDNDADVGDGCEQYEEENGLVIIEAEHTLSDLDEWIVKTDVEDYKGSGHIEFTGNTTSNGPPSSPLIYTFKINQGGLYQLTLRARKRITPPDGSDKSNDCYVRVEGNYDAGPDAGNNHLDDAPLSTLETDTKIFGGNENSWGWAVRLDLGGDTNKRIPKYDFNAGETYTIVMSGRSKQFNVDRIIFYRLEDYTTNQARDAQDNLEQSTCTEDILSVNAIPTEDNFSMFPNPANDILNFSEIPEGTRVQIFNTLGVLQTDVLIDNGQTSIDVSSLASGFYLINFSELGNSSKNLSTRKLIIE